MSKRYGRQQKRKARIEIERLNIAVKINQRTMNIAACIIDVAREINPNSICFDPNSIPEGINRHAIHNLSIMDFNVANASAPCQAESFQVVDLYRLKASLSNSYFDRAIHFRVGFGSNVAGYSISEEGLRHVPLDYISKEIANHLKHAKD